MKINPKKPSLKRLWMRVHQNIQNLFLKKGIKPTFPKREMLFTAGIQEHYRMELFLIPIFKRVSLNVILSFWL
uniref:FKBP prolyl isomerase 3 n=1 Tax=Molossus molossus TaxID=27622 RepID=A0A7J8JVD1_MOLMO|nr:FKBP prolyl isomerase 3 [Molossus molossus]